MEEGSAGWELEMMVRDGLRNKAEGKDKGLRNSWTTRGRGGWEERE